MNKRKFNRHNNVFKVTYDSFEDLYRDYTLNISRGGTFILTQQQFQIGDNFRIHISFPKLLKPIPIDVEVMWTFEENYQDNMVRGVGVRFLFKNEYHEKKFAKLMDFISRHHQLTSTNAVRILFYHTNPFIRTSFDRAITELNKQEEFKDINLILRQIEREEDLILNFLQGDYHSVILGGTGFDPEYYIQEFKKHDNLIPYIGLGIDQGLSQEFDLTLAKPFTTSKIKSLLDSILKLSKRKRS